MNATAVPREIEPTDALERDVAILLRLSAMHVALGRTDEERRRLTETLAVLRGRLDQVVVQIEVARRESPPTDGGETSPLDSAATQPLAHLLRAQTAARARLDEALADIEPRMETIARERAMLADGIKRMAARLSSQGASIHTSLCRVHRLPFVAPLKGDWCGGCNLRLPSRQVCEIHRLPRLHRCPFCKRVVTVLPASPSE